jgi:ankyrin repeat protein
MHPLLTAAACRGDLEELMFLLNRGTLPPQEFRDQLEVYYPGNSSNRSLAMQPTADRIEEGTWTASSILEGVTVEGDTALHLLATNGLHDKFKECVDLIYNEDKSFLYKENYNGDTPLHCAVRTRNSHMVSHVIGLARGENRVECLLRKENNSKETALHEAVRIGDNDIVKELLMADPKLARFPEEGPSPLYLAIFLEEGSIAHTLYDKSEDHAPSYSGPDGQNALHAAVMRRTGTLLSIILIYFEL